MIFHEINEAKRVAEIGRHRFEIAIIDAEQHVTGVGEADVGADFEKGIHLVDFDEGGHFEFGCENEKIDEETFGEGVGDEEDGICPGSA